VDPTKTQSVDDFGQEVAHCFWRHNIGPAFRSAETRQVESDQRRFGRQLRPNPRERVEAFRPGAGQQDGNAALPAAAEKTQLQPVDCDEARSVDIHGCSHCANSTIIQKGASGESEERNAFTWRVNDW